jgi:glycosyltransferase involved in cell wall biosynthesis
MPARRLPSLSRWRALAGQLSFVPAKLALTAGVRFVEWLTGEFSQPVLKTKQQFCRDATERILQNTDLFLAPSLFLKEKFLSCGLRPEKIRHLPYGICRFPPGNKVPRQQKLRIGYLGALHAHKGLEVLLAAFQGLNDTAELHIHGNTFGSPVSEQYWKRVRQQPDSGVIVHGPYRNEQLPDILTTLDVVVVPSLWYENAPLTIQEALLAKVPVVTSDCGGMAEMIQHEVNGLLFPMGDSRGLHNALQRLIQEDGLLSKLQSEIRNVLLIEHQAREVLAVYQKLCQTTEDTCTPSDGDRSCLLQDSTANVSASTSGAAHEARQMQQETSAGLNSH